MMNKRSNSWTLSSPGLLIILLDQSSDMSNMYMGETKAKIAADITNNIISSAIDSQFSGEAPKDRFSIAVVGYNTAASLLMHGSLSHFANNPLKITEDIKILHDGAGGYIQVPIKKQIWFEPVHIGERNMRQAFKIVSEIIDIYYEHLISCPIPIIANITGGCPYKYNEQNIRVIDEEYILKDMFSAVSNFCDDGNPMMYSQLIPEECSIYAKANIEFLINAHNFFGDEYSSNYLVDSHKGVLSNLILNNISYGS